MIVIFGVNVYLIVEIKNIIVRNKIFLWWLLKLDIFLLNIVLSVVLKRSELVMSFFVKVLRLSWFGFFIYGKVLLSILVL